MSVDLATLNIEVNSSQVRNSAVDLDRLSAAAGRTERGVRGAGTAAERTDNSVGGLGRATRRTSQDVSLLGGDSQRTARSVSDMGGALGRAGNAFSGLRGAIAGGLGALLSASTVSSFLRVADSMKVMESQLKSVVGAGSEYQAVYDRVLSIANKNQASLGSTAELYVKTARAMKPMGKTADEIAKFTDNMAATFRASGMAAEDQAGAIMQLSQSMGKGILNGDEFTSISERAPMVMQALADSMNVPIAKLKEMGGEGQITADIIFNAFQKVPPAIAGIEVTTTVSGSLTVLQNNFNNWIGSTDKATGTSKVFADAIMWMAGNIDILASVIGVTLVAALVVATEAMATFALTSVVGFVGSIPALVAGFGSAAVAAWGFTAALLANPITWIVVGLVALGVAIYAVVQNWDVIKAKTIEVWDSIQAKLSEAWDSIKSKMAAVWDSIKNSIAGAWEGVGQAISAAIAFVAVVFQSAWNGVLAVWDGIKSAFETGFHLINGLFVSFPILNFIFPIIGGLLWLARNWTLVSDSAVAAWGWIVGAVSGGWDAVKSLTSGAWGVVTGWFSSGWDFVKTSSSEVWSDVVSAVSEGWDSIATFFSGAWNGILSSVSEGWESVKQYASDGMAAVVSAITNNPLVQWFVQVWDEVCGYMSGLPSRFMQIGADVVNGLWNGLKAKWGEVTAWVSGAMSNLISVSKASLDSHSPSRKFIKIGHDVMDGLAIGLKNYAGKAVDELNAVSKSMLGVDFGVLKGKGADAVIDYLMKIRDITREIGQINKNGAVNPYQNLQSLNDDMVKDPKKYTEIGGARVTQLQKAATGADSAEAGAFINNVGVDMAKKLADMQRETELIGLSEAAANRLNFERELSAELDSRKAYHTPELLAQSDAMKQKLMGEYDATAKLREEKERLAQIKDESWGGALKNSWEGFVKDAGNSADKMKGVFDNAFNGISSALGDLITTGKADFKSLASSILSEMSKVLMSQAFSKIFGGLGGGGGFLSSLAGMFGFANGGAFNSGVQMFANGGAFTNSIASSPTAFGMSGGKMGIMGEAGPEAIMPLTRTSGGQLGVRAMIDSGSSGGSGNSVVVNVVTNVQSNGQSKTETSTTGSAQGMKQFGEMMAAKAREVISNELRQGGLLANLA